MNLLIKKQAESRISFGTDFQSCISCMFLLTIEDSISSPAVNNVNYYSTIASFYHIWSRERAKYETVISQFGVSKNTCARRDKKKHKFFFFCHAKYTQQFALKKICIFKICLILSRRAHVFFETPN